MQSYKNNISGNTSKLGFWTKKGELICIYKTKYSQNLFLYDSLSVCYPKISYSIRSTIHEDQRHTCIYKLYQGYYRTLGQCCKNREMPQFLVYDYSYMYVHIFDGAYFKQFFFIITYSKFQKKRGFSNTRVTNK